MNKFLASMIFFTSAAMALEAHSENKGVADSTPKIPKKELMCRACHGPGGSKPIAPNYPKLNGQNKAYLVAAMEAYKSGDRKGTMASVMTAQVVGLSEQEINELAAYYARVQID